MYCKNCGNEINESAVACMKCGFAKGNGDKFCANCGSAINPGAAICINCGAAVSNTLAANGEQKSKLVAVDNVGAGIGEIVLVTCGSAARLACGDGTTPVDAAVVGIVDDGTGLE